MAATRKPVRVAFGTSLSLASWSLRGQADPALAKVASIVLPVLPISNPFHPGPPIVKERIYLLCSVT